MRNLRRSFLILISAAVAALGTLAPARAADGPAWPQRPVKLILPLGAGSGVDIGARLFADRLSQRWGQPVIVENRPGGDGLVAISAFLTAHDDHVLLVSPTSSFTAHPYLHDSLPYKPSDLHPIARVSNTVVSVTVPEALKVASLSDLLTRARAAPGTLNWAGMTGALDFVLEDFLRHEKASISKVPYKNPVEATNDLAENRVQLFEGALAIVQPMIQAHKVRPIAVINKVRAPAAPDVPTVAEAGFPFLTMDGLVGWFGPPNLKPEVRDRIAADIRAVAKDDPVIGQRLQASGQILNFGDASEFAAAIAEQRAKVDEVAKELGLKAAKE